MYKYTVTAEAYNTDRSQLFYVLAPNVDRAWSKAYYQCSAITQSTGIYWTPTNVVKFKEDEL